MASRRGPATLLAGAFLVAGGLTAADVRIASPAPVTLTAARADVAVPRDPWASIWDRASAVAVPLSAQSVTRPIGGKQGSLTARAMHDGRRIYILAEWKDATDNLSASSGTVFADQVAVEFPTERGDRLPYFCMGDPAATVNIWVWKASRQVDVDRGYQDIRQAQPGVVSDVYPFEDEDTFYPPRALGNPVASVGKTPVESLIAGGFGSLTDAGPQAVDGVGRWKRSSWRVVFSRALAGSGDGDVAFAVPESTSIAFAVWNGAAKERNGEKSVAQFLGLEVSDQPLGAPPRRIPVLWITLASVLVVLFVLGGARLARPVPVGSE